MNKVLIVAYYFPPVAAIGAMRPLGFCRYLSRYGWSPSVVAVDPSSVWPPTAVDNSLCELLPPGLRVERIPHINPLQSLIELRERLWKGLGKENPVYALNELVMNADHKQTRMALGQAVKTFLLEWAFEYPDRQKFWVRSVVRHLSRLHREEIPDVVLATGGPWTALLAGRALAKRFRVPFVADFRDPWTTDPAWSFLSPSLTKKSSECEKSVCSAARVVVANTEELRIDFCNKYPNLADRFVTITNGFHAETEFSLNGKQVPDSVSEPAPIELCHFGTIYGGAAYGKRNVTVLLHAMKELYDEKLVTASQLRVRFIGVWGLSDPEANLLVTKLEKDQLVSREPSVPHSVCLQRMARAGALLLLQPNSYLRVPAKTYEYIAAQRPIVIVGPEGAASNLIQRHQLGLWCRDDVHEVKQLLLSLVRGELTIKPPNPTIVNRFEYSVLTKKLASVLELAVSS